MLAVLGFTLSFAATAVAEFIQPAPPNTQTIKQPVRIVADLPPVRVVGPQFVPNLNPREH